jgi:transposase
MNTLTPEQVQNWISRAKTKRDVQRVQCMSLHFLEHLSSAWIAPIVGMSAVTVRRVWTTFAREGEESLFDEKRGGRHREHFSQEEEKVFLDPFLKKARAGGLINIKPVHNALEKKIGKKIPSSTTYAMLHRQGWRKIAPRAHHPQGNPTAREKFKASFPPDREKSADRSGNQRSAASRPL